MNEMSEFDQKIHRTWVQLLVDHGYREAAAIAIDMQVDISGDYGPDEIVLDVPISMYSRVKNDESLRTVMERALLAVCSGHLYDQNNASVSVEDLSDSNGFCGHVLVRARYAFLSLCGNIDRQLSGGQYVSTGSQKEMQQRERC